MATLASSVSGLGGGLGGLGGLVLATVVTSDPHPPSTPRNFWKLPLAIGFWGCHFSGTGIDNSIFAGVSVVIANPLVTFVHDIQSHNERHITVTLGDPTNPPRRQNLVWMPHKPASRFCLDPTSTSPRWKSLSRTVFTQHVAIRVFWFLQQHPRKGS